MARVPRTIATDNQPLQDLLLKGPGAKLRKAAVKSLRERGVIGEILCKITLEDSGELMARFEGTVEIEAAELHKPAPANEPVAA